eukprot:256066-Rhodomonas_salina.4
MAENDEGDEMKAGASSEALGVGAVTEPGSVPHEAIHNPNTDVTQSDPVNFTPHTLLCHSEHHLGSD